MNKTRLAELRATYRDGLLENTLPFWIRHAVDHEYGGYLTGLDHDGLVIETDKGIWQQGRFAWLLGHLHNHLEPNPEWLEVAASGINFLRQHGFDADGRMWFQVTRDGRPLRKRRYLYSECFTIMALAEFARAANDESAARQAIDLYEFYRKTLTTPGALPPKFTETRPLKSIGVPMIEIGVCHVLRETLGYAAATASIDRAITEIANDFVKDELRVVMESVEPDGTISNHFDGRTLNPGHAIEAAWFIMREGIERDRDDYKRLGCRMLDYMWERGWDAEYGGIFYFRDLHDLPVQEYWHDMKFWWPHNEAIIATLMAWKITGNECYAAWHTLVHDWAYQHFPDPEHGEWFGYLHRDGSISVRLKGNLWKGAFHLPRMQWTCWQLLED
ncbi:MAG: AGE family epimerase/isomerase [Planctomycetales bacterium]|nr:AGE family epimerase/isomerase [Planctomycetales bacterium]